MMLNKKFKHKHWFIGKEITIKEFLDYVLRCGDFHIKTKYKPISNNLLDDPEKIFYLVDDEAGYTYRLNQEERTYLAEHNDYFKSKLSA